jgi:iron complex outermembrane receptor protein
MSALPQLTDLKLRASWGVNGNQAIGNYLAYSSYLYGDGQTQAQFGNTFVTTIRPSAADPGIKWEETTSYNIGLDYGFANNRITGAVDYYQKKTEDLLFLVPVAAGTNLSNFLTTNIGDMENRGFEFSINALLFDGTRSGFTWNASLNASTNSNELLQINPFGGGGEQILTGGISGGVGSNIQVLQPGHPINSFFVYQHKRDANGRPVHGDTNDDGSITDVDLYEDLNDDGAITQSDRRPYKSPAPKWILGHSSQMTYRNFDAGFTVRAYRGNYVYNNVASNLGHYSALRGDAPSNLHASVLANQFDNPQYFSDVYVEDASFIRMDNLSVGYTFRNLRSVSELRLFGTVQNVFTVTDYSGVDPLSGVNGIDNNIYPFSRIYAAGISLGF